MSSLRTRAFLMTCAVSGIALSLSTGCLPDNAFREVFAENLVRTTFLAASSLVSLLFLNVFPFI